MSNRKITQLVPNTNPTLADVFPIVNNGVTKQLSLTGLTSFIAPYIDTVNPIFTGGTVSGATIFTNGLTANTISATTYQNLPIDVRVTGGTYSSGITTFRNNTGGTFSVSGFSTGGPISTSGTSLYSNNPQTSGFSTNNTIAFGSLAGQDATGASQSNFFGISAGQNATGAYNSSFIGYQAGQGATNAHTSNFIGQNAGNGATGANNSNFIGQGVGVDASGATNSNFIGSGAGYAATNANDSNFIGFDAGDSATNANNSNFIGYNTGQGATSANNSNFIGYQAGQFAINAAYSSFIGYNVGASFTGNELGSNNIIIGTNISLPNDTIDSINIGGVLFGTGAYSDINGDPKIIPQSTGRIGIGVVTPTANLHIAASTTASAIMRLEVGPAPSAPNDGDIWLESNDLTGLKIRISGVTRTINIT